ncbi:MAG TPA: condensation domain-containing protein, partial [Vicinamibacteria bacterium]
MHLSWTPSARDGSFDAELYPPQAAPRYPNSFEAYGKGEPIRAAELANTPMRGALAETLVPSLRDFLRRRLPDYMVPATFVLLDRMPTTAGGKVDRNALPEPESHRRMHDRNYVPPRTAVEMELASIWEEILGLDRVGVRDDFFELGGHSLLATQVMSRVRQRFQLELPLRDLFEHPTIERLAKSIDRAGSGSAPSGPPLLAVSRDRPLPLSFAQQRLWFLDQLVPGNAFYNVPCAVRLKGNLNVPVLHQVFREIVRRHEALRSTFDSLDGNPVQIVGRFSLRVPVVDLRALRAQAREREVRRLSVAEARTPFDLRQGPPMRAMLCSLADREHAVLMVMHHIVSDGWSLGVMVGEVAALYASYLRGMPSPLPELSVQYADYASWQREWLSGEVLEKQRKYWRERLWGAPVLELPTDRPRPAVQTFRGRSYRFELSRELREKLLRLSQREGVTLFMLLLAGFQALLSRMSGQTDVVVGSPIANRTRPEIEGLIGFFVNSLVLRTDLSGEPSFEELLGRVREGCLSAYAHQDLPFEKLVEELSPERDLSREPLFQVMFALQNAPIPAVEIPGGLSLFPLEIPQESSKFDLTVSLLEPRERWFGLVEFNRDLFDLTTIARIVKRFEILLEGAAIDPRVRLSDIPLLSASERSQMVHEWNDTAVELPRGVLLHQRFEAQVRRSPDAIALADGELQLSYSALDEAAEGLARRLRKLGVGPDDLVGVCCERSARLAIALLGVLKADGAFVPLEPSYPAERL